MADVNVNAHADQAPTMAPPTWTDDQIMPHIRWVPIGKSNYYFDVERSQSNPIFKITVDILKNTNFFCQLDEKWFDLTKDILRDALLITPVDNNNAFSSPPTPDALINFVNDLGYPKVVKTLSDVVTNDMFQPWRALTTIINLCLTGKTSGFEIPRALVLQILWGVVNRAHINYAERIWEEFTQSIHTFIEDKKNLTQHTHGKKKATLIVIPSVRFTKLIIYYLQSKHKFHPRLDSPLHLPKEEPGLGYLKFSAKGTNGKSLGCLFRMNLSLLTFEEKKCKLVTETSDKPSPAKSSKPGLVTKRRKPTSSLRLVDESVDEGIPKKEPRFDDEEADIQMAVEESLKSVHDVPWGPLPPVVIREPDSGRFQPLPEVQGKSKEKVSDKQVARDLLTLQTPKKEVHPVVEVEAQDEVQAGPNPDVLTEGQARLDPGDDAEPQPQSSHVVHAGPNLEHMDLKATDVILEEPASSTGTLSSLQHLAKDFSFGDLFFNDKPSEAENEKTTREIEVESMVSVTIQQETSAIPHMTTPVIDFTSRPDSPNAHWPLQATATETTMKTTTTTTYPPPSQPQQSTTDPMLIKRIGKLEQIIKNLVQDNKHLEERDLPEADMKDILHQRMWETNSYKAHEDQMMIYKALEKFMNRDHTDELLKGLAAARRKKKKRHDSPKTPPGSPPHQPPPPSPPPGQSHGSTAPSSSKTVASAEYTAWTTTDTRLRPYVSSIPEDLHMDDDIDPDEHPLKEDRPATPEPARFIPSSDLPVPTNNWASALASTYTPPPENSLLAQTGDMAIFMDWFCKIQGITKLKPQDLEGPAFELVKVFHPHVIHLQYQMEECYKLLTDSVDESIIKHNVSKPLPLGDPPDQVTIQSDIFFNKDLKYLRYDSKGGRHALSISKMKAAYYPDVGLEQMVPDQMWIEEECKYDIVAMYGISHWWFQRQCFYIDRNTSEGDCRAVRTHMQILSVVIIKIFSMYGYDYMKKIVLRRADINEHIIAKRDFKYLYPRNFEYLYLFNLQGHLNHLPSKDKKILTTAANLWTGHLVIRQRVEDFQLGIESYQTQLNLTKP
nr:hypothetical protein [Tanacetum cinerariifolium]